MNHDIRTILEKLTLLEGTVTSPALPKKGLNQQQKSVDQMPALFRPKGIKVLGNKKDPTHPAKGYFVGGESKEPYCDACDRVESQCICDKKVAEDLITNVRRTLDDYLQDIEQKLSKQKDRELINKAGETIQKNPLDSLLPVKTIDTEEEHPIRIHGNENDGFIIRIKDRPLSAKFRSLDEAEMVCELLMGHRRNRKAEAIAQDYVEEA